MGWGSLFVCFAGVFLGIWGHLLVLPPFSANGSHGASFSPVWSVELVLPLAAAVRLHIDSTASVMVGT